MPSVRAIALLLAAMLLSACQVRVASDIAVNADGSGTMTLSTALDQELWESLTADGFDPFAGLDPLADSGWTATLSPDDGGQRFDLSTDFSSPEELASRIGELNAGLDEEDPRILADPVLVVSDDAASLQMQAGLRPPTSTGVDGAPIEFDGQDLAQLLETRGDEVFRYDLRVTMPGPIEDSNADDVDDHTATWDLTATGLREVRVASTVAGSNRTLLVAVAAGLLALAMVGVTVALVRRRRGARSVAPTG